MKSQKIQLKSGRRVKVYQTGLGETPVVFCHPAPDAGNFDPMPEAELGNRRA
jgi:hypothetical protein